MTHPLRLALLPALTALASCASSGKSLTPITVAPEVVTVEVSRPVPAACRQGITVEDVTEADLLTVPGTPTDPPQVAVTTERFARERAALVVARFLQAECERQLDGVAPEPVG